MIAHLSILQVTIPLLGAPLCLLLRGSRTIWLFAGLVSLLTATVSLALLWYVYSEGVVSYSLGGWEAPWGIEYRVDLLNAFVLVILSVVSLLVLAGGRRSMQAEVEDSRQPYFWSLYLLCLAGLLGITATGDAFNVFVFLEISSLASYALIAIGRDRRALWSSFQYLIMGTIGATFILISIGLMYMMTGTLNMADLAIRLPEVADSRTIYAAYAFFVVGVCLKLALFPLHLWLPNAYSYAPSIVTAFLAASATKVAVYLLIRFSFSVFGVEFSLSVVPLQKVFLVLGFAGVFVASAIAFFQENLKRMLAYSSVAQIGYMIVGFSLGSASGVTASLIHLFNHALMKGALFMALAAVALRIGGTELKQLAGLRYRMPWTSTALVVGGLSLVGVPLTAGFVSKWYLVSAALEESQWVIASLIVIGSLLSMAYVWRLVEVLYFSPADPAEREPAQRQLEAPLALLVALLILAAANIYFGLDTRFSIGVSETAVQQLFGGGG